MNREGTRDPGSVAEDDRELLQCGGKLCHRSHGNTGHGRRGMEGKTVSKGVTDGLTAGAMCSGGWGRTVG